MTITIDGNDFDWVLDTVFSETEEVALPEWVNYESPLDVDSNVWTRFPLNIIYTLRATDAEKWILDQILFGHTQVLLTDVTHGIEGKNVWLRSLMASYRIVENKDSPWLIDIELVYIG